MAENIMPDASSLGAASSGASASTSGSSSASDGSSASSGSPIQLTGKADLTDPANLVWSTSKLPGVLGGIGLTTRGVLDVAIVMFAVFLGTIGVIMLMKPDLQRLLSAAKNLPPVIPV